MKRQNKLWAGAIAAAITFATLMLVLGPASFAKYSRHHPGKHCMEQKDNQSEKE